MFNVIGADGLSYGPVDADTVRGWIRDGRVTLDCMARLEHEESWKPLCSYQEFAPSTPPPLPPLPGIQPPPIPETRDPGPLPPELPELAASRLTRLLAWIIDTSLSLFFGLPGMTLLVFALLRSGVPLEEAMANGFKDFQTPYMVMMFGMLIPACVQVWLLSTRGQTVGKLLLQIRIVRELDGGPVGFIRAFGLRSALPTLIGMIPGLGLLFTLTDILFIFHSRRRCLHDLIAGTRVVKETEDDFTN